MSNVDPVTLANLGELIDRQVGDLDTLVATWTEMTGEPPRAIQERMGAAPPAPPADPPSPPEAKPEPVQIDRLQMGLLAAAERHLGEAGLDFDEWSFGRERLRAAGRPWGVVAEARVEGRTQRKFVLTPDELQVVDPATGDPSKLTDIYAEGIAEKPGEPITAGGGQLP